MSENNKEELQRIAKELDAIKNGSQRKKYSRFTLSCLSSIPWFGGVLSAAASADSEKEQEGVNELYKQWLDEHTRMFAELSALLSEIIERLDKFEDIEERIQSDEYQKIVKRAFQAYERSDGDIRRKAIRNIVVNTAVGDFCHDNVVKLFADWINTYSEFHFKVISEIFNNQGISRGEIWTNLVGDIPTDSSAEADLFKLLFRDLSTGSVIRQYREVDYAGRFVNKPKKRTTSSTAKSPFDFNDPYELTELGKQFVHYVLTDSVKTISENN